MIEYLPELLFIYLLFFMALNSFKTPMERDHVQIIINKAFHWFIIMSSTISLVHMKNCLPSWFLCNFLSDITWDEPMKFLMTSL